MDIQQLQNKEKKTENIAERVKASKVKIPSEKFKKKKSITKRKEGSVKMLTL